MHRIDPKVPADDQLRTLKDLQSQGKFKHIGLSEVTVRQIEHVRTIVSVTTVQNRYSLSDRNSEDVLNYYEQQGIGFIPWFPLAAGRLSGGDSPLGRLARKSSATPSQIPWPGCFGARRSGS
jgi:pyridoxine 4-dehydrogenase